jgi:hypothetical protein
VSNGNSGLPTVQAFWPGKTIVGCDWFLGGSIIVSASPDITLVPTADNAGVSRYTGIAFGIVETYNRSFPLSYINFSVYHNGGL